MTAEEREYVLGTHDAELARLGFQHQVWGEATVASWEHARFRRGDTLLDVGCGPGYATFGLANLVGPDGRVIAVDMSQRFIAHVRREAECRGIAHVHAEAQDLAELDLPDESLDGAFARWVMCFLPDPATVIARVARALRPGAAFAILDYSHYEGFRIGPPSAATERVFAAVAESFRAHGGNPNVGMELPAQMHAAGLEVREIRPLVRIGRPGTALWEWPRTFFEIFLPTLVSGGSLSAGDEAAFWADYEARTADPAGFFTSPPMVEVIGVKPVRR
jgi:ubiquinone/menaquinone biosynthesis C-methylase UbiE